MGGNHNPETDMTDMTTDERKAAFNRMFAAIPDEPRGQRVKTAAEWAMADENTVRIWSMANPPRVPSLSKLKLLELNMRANGVMEDGK